MGRGGVIILIMEWETIFQDFHIYLEDYVKFNVYQKWKKCDFS